MPCQSDSPRVYYLHGNKEHCLWYSLASALHFVGEREAGSKIYNNSLRLGNSLDTLTSVITMLNQALPKYLPITIADNTGSNNKSFNPLDSNKICN